MQRFSGILVSLAVTSFFGGSCGDKSKEDKSDPVVQSVAAVVEGVDAIPASASVVVGIDVEKLSKSPVVLRALERMFARDKNLKEDISAVLGACDFDLQEDLKSAIIAIVPREKSSLTDSLLVAKGKFSENAISGCLGRFFGERGGKLEIVEQDGRRIYHESSANPGQAGELWFSFGSKDTLLVASDRSALLMAFGKGAKLSGKRGRLSQYLPRAKADAGIWAIYQFDEAIAQGLTDATEGKFGPAKAGVGHADFGEGLSLAAFIEMANEEDAKSLSSLISAQLPTAVTILQAGAIGRLVQKIEVSSEGNWAQLSWSLSQQELADLLGSNLLGFGSTIDNPGQKAENPALAPASGPGAESDTKNGNQHTNSDSKKEFREQSKAHQ